MDNYLTSFHLLTHLGVNNIRATRVLNKNRLCKCTITGDKQPQNKRNVATLNSAYQAKKQCNFDTGENYSSAIYIAFSESCEPKRFVRSWNKVERKSIQE